MYGRSILGEKKQEIIMFGRRRDLLLFDRFLPYVVDASCTVFDRRYILVLISKGKGFPALVLQGFGRNWPRRLQMESMLPSFSSGIVPTSLQRLIKQTSIASLEKNLFRAKGAHCGCDSWQSLIYPGSTSTHSKRFIFEEIDMQRLEVLGTADTFAREYLVQGRVSMKAAYHHDGSLHFEGSTVTEPREEDTPFVAEPSFFKYIGHERFVATVLYGRQKSNWLGGPCSHLRALWLKYCQEQEALREAKDEGCTQDLYFKRSASLPEQEGAPYPLMCAQIFVYRKWRNVETKAHSSRCTSVYDRRTGSFCL